MVREYVIVEYIFSYVIVNWFEVMVYFDCFLKLVEIFNGDFFLCELSFSGGIYFVVGDFIGYGLVLVIGVLFVIWVF